ncbi:MULTISPECIES: amino acid ABC transporter permease [Rummeliibacillus]|jgi:polar amino acid transport system permease protein|uniref:amino acid ABC transporter permease n=1 Tax=Rummeliibacillus TaxID=648802 RepID=UPI0011B7C08F|nr:MULTISPECIES: amino acid ABC transporter permease [Rummeliibacillus]
MGLDFSVLTPFIPALVEGAWMTIQISFLSLVIGLVLAILGAFSKLSPIFILRKITEFYVWVFRGTPLLVQLFIIYFGIPQLGVQFTPFQAAVLGLSLNTGAYATEIVRSALQAVDKGQYEAAAALGMSKPLAMYRIIGPQALKILVPAMVNQFVMTVKNSSMVSLLTITELFRTGESIITSTFHSLEVYLIIAAIYLVITSVLMFIASRLEKGMRVYD